MQNAIEPMTAAETSAGLLIDTVIYDVNAYLAGSAWRYSSPVASGVRSGIRLTFRDRI
jgi:hypothetical protein